ncbi:DDE-type integrase/transposase/recombinase, partial [Shewanella sp. 202IG2-18]|nr:DDE-type integrase/transposase/recombinase [Parashewanella hymeniacidonis]
IDKSGSNAAALETLNWQLLLLQMAGCLIEVLQVKYLNNIVDQSHRAVKWQMRTALDYKSIEGAKATIAGVELWQMIRKGQMKGGTGSIGLGAVLLTGSLIVFKNQCSCV